MNIYWWIFKIMIDCLLILYFVGKWAVKKEFKDTWGNVKTMEVNKSKELSQAWSQKYPILNFLQDCYYEIRRKLEIPEEIYNQIKWFIQRGKRGYADCDVWCVDSYLSKLLPKMFNHLKRVRHILPTWKKGESEEIAQQRWNSYLDKMINTFEIANKIINDHYIYTQSTEYDREDFKESRESLSKLEFVTIMNKEECEVYEEGWKLFQEHFFSLWD